MFALDPLERHRLEGAYERLPQPVRQDGRRQAHVLLQVHVLDPRIVRTLQKLATDAISTSGGATLNDGAMARCSFDFATIVRSADKPNLPNAQPRQGATVRLVGGTDSIAVLFALYLMASRPHPCARPVTSFS